MRRSVILALLLAAAEGFASAQDVAHRTDTLSAGDERYDNRFPIRWYSVTVREGFRLAIRVASVDFTPTIVVSTGSGGDQTRVGRAGSAAYSYRADSDAAIRVGITASTAAEPGGSYLVGMKLIRPEPPITIGERRQGTLTCDDETLEEGKSVDWYSLRISRGQRLAIAVWSDDFSPALLGILSDGSKLAAEQSASGHAIARFVAPEDGEMRIGVSAEKADSEGSFNLQVMLSRDAKTIKAGERIHGTLHDGGDMLAGQPIDLYRLHGKAGDSVTLSFSSAAFDPLLVVQDRTNHIEQNDDISDSDTNSKLRYTFDGEGDLEIRVYSIDEKGRGAYELSTDAAEPPQTLRSGDVVRGRLSGDDEQRDGKLVDRYLFQGREGERIRIDLRSTDFDTYLVAGDVEGKTLENDDLSEDVTDSQLTYVFPRDGRTVIMATTYSGEDDGSYTLEVGAGSGEGKEDAVGPGSA